MKSGDDIMQNGSIVATSARKAAEKGKIALAKVKTKISSVKSKISSSVKTSMDKAKLAGAETIDNIKIRAKKAGESEGFGCKIKTFATNKSSCFTEDTLVKTEEGLKAIGDLKVGEKVYSVDEDNVYEEANLKEIKQVIETQTDTLVKLKIDGEEIRK